MRLIIAGGEEDGAVEIASDRFVIGREPDSDLTLDDTKVSRHHASLSVLEDGRVELKDLESANGTFVNGSRIETAMLESGDKVRVGATTLRFEADSPGSVVTEETPSPRTVETGMPFVL